MTSKTTRFVCGMICFISIGSCREEEWQGLFDMQSAPSPISSERYQRDAGAVATDSSGTAAHKEETEPDPPKDRDNWIIKPLSKQ